MAVLATGIAGVLAGCGGEEDTTTEAGSISRTRTEAGSTSRTTTEATLSPAEHQIEQVGNIWAPLFAKDVSRACSYMFGQPVCEEYFGAPGTEVRRPSEFQKSFANVTVERVEAPDGTHKAGAEFSNGAMVEFFQSRGDAKAIRPHGPLLGGWFIDHVGAGEKYFLP
jgi:hypothetical protein